MAEETKIIRLIIDSSKAVDGGRAAQRALEQIERQTGTMDAALARMEKGFASLSSMVKARLSLAVAELGVRIVQIGKDAFSAASGLDELAEQSGVTARGLQALQYSAVQNGLKLEQLETGLGKFSQKMGEAADGSKEMIEALDRIGVKILDADGKLRDNEAIMGDVARSIVGIEDPAKRAAAAVDFFGKAGVRMLPLLTEVARGTDTLAAAAERAGVIISDSTIKRLDKLADRLEAGKIEHKAYFAEIIADTVDWFDKVGAAMSNGANAINAWLKRQVAAVGEWLTPLVDGLAVAGARGAAMFLEAFHALPEQFGKLFADGMNRAIEGVEKGLNLITSTLAEKAPWLGIGGGGITLGRINGGGASLGDYTGQITAAGDAAAARMQALQAEGQAARDRARVINQQAGMEGDENRARLGKLAPVNPGFSNPGIKGAGQAEADRIDKLTRDTARDAAAATAYAEASERGARAVADLELHFKALKAAQDAFGSTADRNAGQVAALTAKIEEQMKAADRARNLKDFNLETEGLEKANALLAAESALINASAETRAREIALIKLKQEVQAKVLDESNAAEKAAIDRRGEAIAQNERLKAQGEELKKANELWTEPLKGALQSIQSTAADMWERILENGKFSMAEFGQLFIRTARRAAAELLALATIRPVIGMGVQALGSMGLVSPSTASSLGYGGIGMPGMGGTGGGGGGGISGMTMPSWLGGGQPFSFFNQPIANSFGRDINSEIANWSTYGTPQQNSLNGGWFGGTTWGQGLGAAAGIGMGAYQLATSKSTAGTIGGIGSMIGAGMSLIPGMQIPGMAISMLSAILPSLFGGDEYKWDPLAGANIRFDPGANGYTSTATQQLGGKSIAGQYGNVAGTLDALYKATGGKLNPGLATGGAIWNNQREGTTSTYAIHPWLGSVQLSEGDGDQSGAVDRMIAKMFYMTATTQGALTGMSPTLTRALGNKEPTSTASVSSLLDLVKAYDALGKVTGSAETAIKQIGTSFEAMTSSAKDYGLALAPIEAEQARQTKRSAQDFIDGMLDPLAVQMRALDDQRKDSIASAEYIRDNVKDVYVDMARIAEYYTRKEVDLKAQFYGQSLTQLQDAIRRLSLGDLANLAPTTMLTGVQAAYQATVAQARSGDSSAIVRLATEGTTLAQAGQAYYASGPDYEVLKQQILDDLRTIQSQVQGGGSGTTGSALNDNNGATQAALAQVAQLQSVVSEQSRQIALLMTKLTETNDLLLRRVANA